MHRLGEDFRRELPGLLSHWGLSPATEPIEIAAKEGSGSLAKVATDGGRFALKVIAADDRLSTPERLLLQQEILGHLSAAGVPVVEPLLDSKGNFWVQHADHRFLLMPWVETSFEVQDVDLLIRNWACLVGAMHSALADLPADRFAARTWRNESAREAIGGQHLLELARRVPEEIGDLARLVPETLSLLNVWPDLREQIIHRDCHPANILRQGERMVGITDCDHFSIGSPMFDIAYFLVRMLQWYEDEDRDVWIRAARTFLDAYESAAYLNERSRRALPVEMMGMLAMASRFALDREDTQAASRDIRTLRFLFESVERFMDGTA